jgi:hypothetical protein
VFNTDWLVVKLRFGRQLDPVSVVPIKEALITAIHPLLQRYCRTVADARDSPRALRSVIQPSPDSATFSECARGGAVRLGSFGSREERLAESIYQVRVFERILLHRKKATAVARSPLMPAATIAELSHRPSAEPYSPLDNQAARTLAGSPRAHRKCGERNLVQWL